MEALLTIKDSRGKRSTTLCFVVCSFVILNAKFLAAGLTLGTLGAVPVMSAGEYGVALGVVLGMWLGREWQEKRPRDQ